MAAARSAPGLQSPSVCRHCGLPCDGGAVSPAKGPFCCVGCEAVFDLLAAQRLTDYYAGCAVPPGNSLKESDRRAADRFAGLDDPEMAARLVQFDDGRTAVATFAVPSVHCGSCVWLLERLWRFDPAITRSEVNLQRRTVRVEFRSDATSARRLAELLASLGYEPTVDGETSAGSVPRTRRRLYMQLGVAGFAFGNMMIFSIPRYANGQPLAGGFQALFDGLNLALALPVLLFSAADYFRIGWRAVRARTIAIEVPVSIGLAVLFGRSVADIATGRGPGFLDSFAGLVFFLLIGRLFQQKAFERLAFDRSFRSFLPLTVQVQQGAAIRSTSVGALRPGDILVLRRHEIVPADTHLLDVDAAVDYRFLTGEETPVVVRRGERVRAGGRAASAMRLRVLHTPSESELASLWANPAFTTHKARWIVGMGARFGAWFTLLACGLALAGAVAWWPDAAASMTIATAVLIVACPCALTLSAPIALGTAMGMLGRRGLYLKDAAVVLDLSRIDTVIFDKTGTLTTTASLAVVAVGGLTSRQWALAQQLAAESSHPVSIAIARADQTLVASQTHTSGDHQAVARPAHLREVAGEGVTGTIDGEQVAIGSAGFVAGLTRQPVGPPDRTFVAVGQAVGWVHVTATARPGIEAAARALQLEHALVLASGDSAGEERQWAPLFGPSMHFRQTPEDKLALVEAQRQAGRHVLMVGDGLNDAGALRAADVGFSVCDDSACIVPACDGVIGGGRLADLPAVLRFARRVRQVVIACFVVSVTYNVVGLTLALTGALSPLASAILMPVSSLTIVGLSSGGVRWAARRVLPA
ncbi:MAG: heavy metal translocating P-type ATPase metal-binding domain-containing protein [Vicinamibacterales bacterium]